MQEISESEHNALVSGSEALSERFQAVVMQSHYVEALAIIAKDGKHYMTVALNKLDRDDCYNLTDFNANYSFVRAVAVELLPHRMNDTATLLACVSEVCSDVQIEFDA